MCPYMIIWMPVEYFDASYEYSDFSKQMFRSEDMENENIDQADENLRDEYYEADMDYINSQL